MKGHGQLLVGPVQLSVPVHRLVRDGGAGKRVRSDAASVHRQDELLVHLLLTGHLHLLMWGGGVILGKTHGQQFIQGLIQGGLCHGEVAGF